MKLRDGVTHDKGFPAIQMGDQFVIPGGFLQFSANPLKGKGHLTKLGLDWYAKQVFIANLPQKLEEFDKVIKENEAYCFDRHRNSELLKHLDIEHPDHGEPILELIYANQDSLDWWTHWFSVFNAVTEQAIEEAGAKKAAWAMACAERCRAMIVYKEHFEEIVWMGHSAKRLVEVIGSWDSNKQYDKEEFWQQLFNENPYILSQLFSVPVIFIKGKAYVGRMNIDNQFGKLVDYLYTTETAKDAILVEIKTPRMKLLGSKYRKSVYSPSSELSGAGVQILDYRRELGRSLRQLTENTVHKIEVFNP
jgi:hypothetical protein